MEPLNKVDQAYKTIRKCILSRTLEPGDRLVERTWAQKLAVNRADVRQALARLVGEGLLENGKKGGVFVPLPDSVREKEFLRARLAVEIGAAYLAVEYATKEDVVELEQIVELMRNLAERKMYAGFCEADMNFHEVLVRSAHSAQLMEIYHRANFPLTLSPPMPRRDVLLQRDAQRHQELLDAMQKRDNTLIIERLACCYSELLLDHSEES